ncbi:MAG: 2-phosphosulfolactate phosphatase [Caldicoprobacterales bacterium]|jgi:2-phosphosulfolactate phosphatase|nr:2-phosphosulfolactate phosphatase [Clostridiales bacterium]
MKITVYPTSDYVEDRDIKDKIVVVIDVLRATSTIITALYNGCKEIIPTADIEDAVNISKNYEKDTFILGGERNAVKIEGFHLSNSPREYSRERVENKTVLITTTNGTKAITRALDAKEVVLASFINISAVYEYIAAAGSDISIICAGTMGKFSADDILVAGALIKGLEDKGVSLQLDDLGMVAKRMYLNSKDDLHGALSETLHYSILKDLGLQGDLDDCLKLDTAPIVPIYSDGVVRA